MIPELIEIKDGLLSTEEKSMMKARDYALFPKPIIGYFKDKTKVRYSRIVRESGIGQVTVLVNEKKSVYNFDLFKYIESMGGRIDYYLSNVPLPGENEDLYPLFARYRNGWICLAPTGVR